MRFEAEVKEKVDDEIKSVKWDGADLKVNVFIGPSGRYLFHKDTTLILNYFCSRLATVSTSRPALSALK
jgi:hypothetical protein